MSFWEKNLCYFVGMKTTTNDMHPYLLDRKNYAYWKIKVKVYIKSIDEKAWRAILIGWSPRTVATEENKVVTFKPDETCSTKEDCLVNNNF